MNKEVTLQQIFSDVVLFFDRHKKLIFGITISGVLVVILFQKLKPAYYETSAIVTSGISAYERIPFDQDEDVLNQRSAINLINNLQLDIKKEDYKSLSYKLDISDTDASQLKFIEAEPLLRQDKDEKFHNTPKFQINLVVRDYNIISNIEDGLLYYFNSNDYILRYKTQYNTDNKHKIDAIEAEIAEIKDLRRKGTSTIDMSTNRIFSSKERTEAENQIISLEDMKSIIRTQDLIKPLDFVKGFTRTEMAERSVLVWGTTIGVLSFFFSLIVGLVRDVRSRIDKE